MNLPGFLMMLCSFWIFCGGLWVLSEYLIYPAIQRHKQRKRERRMAQRLKLDRAMRYAEQDEFDGCYARLQEMKHEQNKSA